MQDHSLPIIAKIDLLEAQISLDGRQWLCSWFVCKCHRLIEQVKNTRCRTQGHLQSTVEPRQRQKRTGQDKNVHDNGDQGADRETSIQDGCAAVPEKGSQPTNPKKLCGCPNTALQPRSLSGYVKLSPCQGFVALNLIILAAKRFHNLGIADRLF